jgi:hypothetical protein
MGVRFARRSVLTLLCTAASVPALLPAGAAESPEEERLHSDWPNLARYRDQNRELKSSGSRIDVVFLGDSITEGWLQKAPAFFGDGPRLSRHQRADHARSYCFGFARM